MKAQESWLLEVEKPARYVGDEWNIIRKDTQGLFRFALCYPDTYEIGMSHLGSRILYEVLNQREDTYCERSYTPWPDAEKKMIEQGDVLRTLETKEPVSNFDIIGFPLLYELTFTNVLTMLHLSGIPLYAKDRTEQHPIIMAGGPVAYHAEPMADFIDIFMLGDGEDGMHLLMDAYSDAKQKGMSRREFIQSCAQLQGHYVPSMYDISYFEDGTIKAITPVDGAPKKVQKLIVKDLDAATFPTHPLVPNLSVIHDRVALELFRGCTQGCRFCQAGYVYRPVRNRKLETLLQQAEESLNNSGYDEISLTSLSTGDYPCLLPLLETLAEKTEEKRISISLPSLRVDTYLKEYGQSSGLVRKGGLTFAPEAATQRLRDIINKKVTEQDLLSSAKDAFASGYHNIKLYFMIGLPGETEEDIDAIATLGEKVVDQYYALPKEQRSKAPQVTIAVSPFVPKPFTPFQWEGQDDMQSIEKKQARIKAAVMKNRRLRFSTHDYRVSHMDAVFARGDRKLGAAIYHAWKNGARLDGWSEHFQYQLWMDTFEQLQISTAFYANRKRNPNEILPYDHIDVCVEKEYLLQELQKAQNIQTTRDCRDGCTLCGLMDICGEIS